MRITNCSNLAAAFAVLLAWLGVGQGRVRKNGYVNSKCFLGKPLYGWILATVFLNTVGPRKGKSNHVLSIPPHSLRFRISSDCLVERAWVLEPSVILGSNPALLCELTNQMAMKLPS